MHCLLQNQLAIGMCLFQEWKKNTAFLINIFIYKCSLLCSNVIFTTAGMKHISPCMIRKSSIIKVKLGNNEKLRQTWKIMQRCKFLTYLWKTMKFHNIFIFWIDYAINEYKRHDPGAQMRFPCIMYDPCLQCDQLLPYNENLAIGLKGCYKDPTHSYIGTYICMFHSFGTCFICIV